MKLDNIIDFHLHLDETIAGDASAAASVLNAELEKKGIEKGLLLHLNVQRWSVEDVGSAIKKFPRLLGFVNINPFESDAKDKLKKAISSGAFVGLKLHPRLEKYPIDHPQTRELFHYAGELNIPTLIDAFPDGTYLMQKFTPLLFSDLALSSPNSKLIVAHMGGHHALDFMMIAKRIPNMYLDFSYSMLYYRGSSVPQDIIYAIKSMRGERIFYGSDYPDRGLGQTLDEVLKVFEPHDLPQEMLEKIFYKNAQKFIEENCFAR